MPLLDAHDPHSPGSATHTQKQEIRTRAFTKGWHDNALNYCLNKLYGRTLEDLSLHQASRAIEYLDGPDHTIPLDSLGRPHCPICDQFLTSTHEIGCALCVAVGETEAEWWGRLDEGEQKAELIRRSR